MIKFKKTLKKLKSVGKMLKVGLQKELIAQKHNATGRLSRGLRVEVKGNTLNVISSASYWKAVNNPSFAKIPNLGAIKSWINAKKSNGTFVEFPGGAVPEMILKRMQKVGYGNRNFNGSMREPYWYYKEGNKLPRRTNFAGYVANKFSKEVAKKLAPSIGKDMASMIREKIKNNTKAKVS
jgi:hypothetical protein